MTQEEWNECTDPTPMLVFLRGKASDRKLRLFAVGCCRRVWHLLPDQRSRIAVEVAERYSDGVANREEMLVALCEAKRVNGYMRRVTGIRHQTPRLAAALSLSLDREHRFLIHVAGNAACLTEEKNNPDLEEQWMQCGMLKDVFGTPFRPISINTNWLTLTVNKLATLAYEERALPSGELDTTRLAILADALEDAGCNNQEILGHLRNPGPHVRGCWSLDLILGKE